MTLTVAVGVIGGVLWLAGFDQVARWPFGVFALTIAGIQFAQMIGRLRQGQFGIDVLAIIAIMSTVAVGSA
ncbi:hypothetical protein [Subtercola boreus]|uniref:hypothetical protein n=1 Tax=Subtercola boreus TaxID=120213 RepID=UPI00209BBE1E|nr:hypothetical protein [Subtercola boreus]